MWFNTIVYIHYKYENSIKRFLLFIPISLEFIFEVGSYWKIQYAKNEIGENDYSDDC